MKKITFFTFLLICAFGFAQRTVTLATINGQAPDAFKTAQDGKLNVGESYTFVVDFTNQETSDNDLIVKVLEAPSFADTPNVASVPITTAEGQLSITLTPTDVVPNAHIQVRTTTTTDFGENSVENVFLFTWAVDAALSNDFNKQKLSGFYSPSRQSVVLNESLQGEFSIFNLLGQSVLSGAVSQSIGVSNLKSGLYILTTEAGTLKFVK